MTSSFDQPQLPRSKICVCLFTDLVGSTAWKRLLQDKVYTQEILIPHDQLFRDLLREFPEAVERACTGDGFLATFDTPSAATLFALKFHHLLATHNWSPEVRLHGLPATRIGIHLGEVIEFSDVSGVKISGQAIDLASRVMSLGDGGYTLLTRHAFDSSRQHVLKNPADGDVPLAWSSHGRYRFKGNDDDPLEIFGVAPHGSSTLSPPANSEKAVRVEFQEETGSWRPATGQYIPHRDNWLLIQQLGEGGFGEVWLGQNKRTQKYHVFKFCFDYDRLRSFKRELALFKLIQSEFGNRSDFVRLIDVQFDEPPFCLESEYVEDGNLLDWLGKNPIQNWPIQDRIEFVAQVAEAVGAAHSVKIVHKDLKPSNILIRIIHGKPFPVIADFGIGVLTDRTILQQHNITMTCSNEILLDNNSSRTGTRLYAPPESMIGKPASISNDVYALGVLLYQLLIGNLERPLGTGWEEHIPNRESAAMQLLTQDIRDATRSDPELRLATVDLLVDRLRRLSTRSKMLARKNFLVKFSTIAAICYFFISMFIWASGLVLLAQGPIVSFEDHYHACMQFCIVVSLFVISGITALLIAFQYKNSQAIWSRMLMTARDTVSLCSCVFGPISILSYLFRRKSQNQWGKAGLVFMICGLLCWTYIAFILASQYRSIRVCRMAELSMAAQNYTHSRQLALESAQLWSNNFVARSLIATAFEKEMNYQEAIKEISAIISAIDYTLAIDPAQTARWLAERYEQRSNLYNKSGKPIEALADKRSAAQLRESQFDVLGYKLQQ